ncbi:MAG: potassium/proton antiporter, partial [Alphaproteobacteria bacterium]|nr:potassium/proton antiporter [Alphaproteobacteria bacterium]
LGDFVFAGTKKMGSLADEYDLPVNRQQRDLTVGQLLANLLPNSPSIGDRVAIGTVELVIRAIQDEQITEVGLVLEPGKLHLLPPGLSGRLATLVARLRRRPVTVDGNDRADEPPVPPRPGLLQRLRTALLRQ